MNISKEPLSETSAKIVVKLDEADYKIGRASCRERVLRLV